MRDENIYDGELTLPVANSLKEVGGLYKEASAWDSSTSASRAAPASTARLRRSGSGHLR